VKDVDLDNHVNISYHVNEILKRFFLHRYPDQKSAIAKLPTCQYTYYEGYMITPETVPYMIVKIKTEKQANLTIFWNDYFFWNIPGD